jgi:hypothetical protein
MRLITVPLVFSVACLAYLHRDKILDQYNAAYPSDPAKQAAIQQCIERNKYFNRLDADDRQACYRQYIPATPIAVAPNPAPYYPYNPSHLPGNDIRRQEANKSYHSPGVIQPAQAEPLSSAPPSPVATSRPVQQPRRIATQRATTPPETR